MLTIEKSQKTYYCPLKDNRQVDDSGGTQPYQRVDTPDWTAAEKKPGKLIKRKGFPTNHKVKHFRVVVSTKRMDYVVTNEMAQDNSQAVLAVCGRRWIVRNHIACTILGSGCVSNRLQIKPNRLFIGSNMACCLITCVSNSNRLLFK